MKNSQVAVLSAVILIAALVVAGSNWMLVRSINGDRRHRQCSCQITAFRLP